MLCGADGSRPGALFRKGVVHVVVGMKTLNKLKTGLTAKNLRSRLSYNKKTGEFRRRYGHSGFYKGQVAGYLGKNGRVFIHVDGEKYYAHRLAWLYVTGGWPPAEIDHKNGDAADNRWSNLRPACRQENMRNKIVRSDSSTGIKGVQRRETSGRYYAKIKKDGKNYTLGTFDTAQEAASAYAAASASMFGDFALSMRGGKCHAR